MSKRKHTTDDTVALGCKNYLFAGSHEAVQNAAMIYSLLASCKINNVEPYAWLKEALTLLPDCPDNLLHSLPRYGRGTSAGAKLSPCRFSKKMQFAVGLH